MFFRAIKRYLGYKNHDNKCDQFFLFLIVTRPGFEPRQAESESAVLPLYYRAIKFEYKLKEKLTPIILKFIQL